MAKEFLLAGVVMKRLLSGAETDGQFCLFENRSDGASRTPIHVHADDDETIYMMVGEMQAIVGGQTKVVRAGETLFLKRGIPHQLMNVSGAPMHYILLCTPSGFEGFVAEGGHERADGAAVAPPTPEDIARMKSAAPRFGITLMQAW
ncbi:cupin domain-containing protein [Acidisoma cellulosilytica]|uniref:Cupin domain-containing protein n=1 Tax=Acidisoma cellulosilyticum TaxID=2802395 RepID=A0A963Z3T4_9PROT|nr:cupin domain-containing protein [Acidisoma cellulosilyticum]MCB8882084.1 cupin domain-containing protein [Acidisoma cellulosilyticum]